MLQNYSSSHCVLKTNLIRPSGDVTTFVEKDGVKSPFDIAMNHKANCFYVTSHGAHTITKITSSGIYTFSSRSFLPNFLWSIMVNSHTHAGTVSAFAGSGEQGSSDGVGSSASFHHPYGIAINQQTGDVFVSDWSDHLIRKITPQGVCMKTLFVILCLMLMITKGDVSTLAGSQQGFADGNGKVVEFSHPAGICFDENSQSLFVCDYGNSKLRRVQLNGTSPSHPPPLFMFLSDHLMQEK